MTDHRSPDQDQDKIIAQLQSELDSLKAELRALKAGTPCADNQSLAESPLASKLHQSQSPQARILITEFLSDLIDAGRDAIQISDAHGNFIYVSQEVARRTGYTQQEMLKMKVQDFEILFQEEGSWEAHIQEMKQLGPQGSIVEGQNRRKDGTYFPVEVSIQWVEYEGTGYVVAVSRDISPRKHAQLAQQAAFEAKEALSKNERLIRSILKHLPVIVYAISPDGRFTFLEGFEVNDLLPVGQLLNQKITHDKADILGIVPKFENLLKGESQEWKIEVYGRYFLQRAIPLVKNDEIESIVGVALDITEQLSLQKALEDERKLLSQRVSDRTDELKKANDELKQASQAKDDFLASMSHELRTPLNSILGQTEALLDQIYGPCNKEQENAIRHIIQSGKHLLALISDILDISKIRAGGMKLNRSMVDVENICSEIIKTLKPEIKRKKLSFSMSLDGQVQCLETDERLFRQILLNLLGNAIKFTEEGKEIGLEVKAYPDDNRLRLSVWDKGIGIKPEDVNKLFKSFVQLDSSLAKNYQGTGLGLSIVKSIMELHNGQVSVESQIGQGSIFHLDFPWNINQQSPTKKTFLEQDFTPPPPHVSKVLMVEDSEVDGEKIKRYFKEMGAHVFWDTKGDHVLDEAKQIKPDVIILDLYLPENSGWELLRILKQDPQTQHIPIIICSVLEEDFSRLEAQNQLYQAYLVKPFSRTSLKKALQQATKVAEIAKALIVNNQNLTMPKKLLLVDDNQSNIQLVHDYLLRKGYEIIVAEDGIQAIEITQKERPSLILMDIQMPKMDGIEATKRIKAIPELQAIPIFALTALAMPGDEQRCLDAGMSAYFSKPVSLKNLHQKIEGYFKSLEGQPTPPPSM
jgi:PAS domain S-box-containing protein